jgi:hypothetical protein
MGAFDRGDFHDSAVPLTDRFGCAEGWRALSPEVPRTIEKRQTMMRSTFTLLK